MSEKGTRRAEPPDDLSCIQDWNSNRAIHMVSNIGYTCSTKRFKQDNGIPQTTKMSQQALMSEIQRDGMNSKQAERRMPVIHDDFASFAERYGQSGLRMMPGDGSFGSAAVAIEAIRRKKTRRQLKIEHKEFAARQIEREERQDTLN
jgi:hypothetical protein